MESATNLISIHSLGRHVVCFSPSTTTLLRVFLDQHMSRNSTPYRRGCCYMCNVEHRFNYKDVEFSFEERMREKILLCGYIYRVSLTLQNCTDNEIAIIIIYCQSHKKILKNMLHITCFLYVFQAEYNCEMQWQIYQLSK